MERDRSQNRSYEPHKTLHGPIIQEVFRTAKKNAWKMLLQDGAVGAKASRLGYLHQMGLLEDKMRMSGDYSKEDNVRRQIQEIEKQPIK